MMRKRRVALLLALMVTVAWASFATAGTALADGPGDGHGPWEWDLGGWWILFPVIMMPMMVVFMFMFMRGGGMFMRGGGRLPWQDSERDLREAEEHRTARPSESALDILKRRYASEEITKAEFDEMKQDLA